MNSALSVVSANFVIFFTIIVLIFGGLLFYALYKKGDVRAAFSHGKTAFKLEAKERKLERR